VGQGLQDSGCCVYKIGKSLAALGLFYSMFKKAILEKGNDRSEVERWAMLKETGNHVAQLYLRTLQYRHLEEVQQRHLTDGRMISETEWREKLRQNSALRTRDPQVCGFTAQVFFTLITDYYIPTDQEVH
jgi:hypothetical protein